MAIQGYSLRGDEVEYKYHGYQYDKVAVLACQIKVWDSQGPEWYDNSGAKVFSEVESVEVFTSYKKLIGTATIRIPRGAVVSVSAEKNGYNPETDSGNISGEGDEKTFRDSTNDGDTIAPGVNIDKKTKDGLKIIDPIRPDVGLIEVDKSVERIIDRNDFAIGNRIEIRMGYLFEPDEDTIKNTRHVNGEEVLWNSDGESVEEKQLQIRSGKELPELDLVFSGFITGISPTSPLEVKCENMASLLKKKSSPESEARGDCTVADFLAEGGKYDLLKGTGIKLDEATEGVKDTINLGKVNLSSNCSVYDILDKWQNCGLLCVMSRDGKRLRVGRALWSGAGNTQNKENIDYRKSRSMNIIQFDWDVAEDKLSIMERDRKFLAIDASGEFWDESKKKLSSIAVTVRKDDDGNWDIVNEREPAKTRKQQKVSNGQNGRSRVRSKVDLSTYTRLPYRMAGRKCTKEELIKEAKAYYNKANMRSISGTVTVFGDRLFDPTDIVCLVDTRCPEKNGYYMVESVTSTFGENGYRHELNLSYRTGELRSVIQYIEL